MIRFLLRRFGWLAITMLVVYTVTFTLMHSVPGGPFDSERDLDPEIRKNIEARYNLDQPLPIQYLSQLGNALMLDLGPCYKMPDFTVNEIIAQGFPISASLGILAMVFAMSLGLTGGIVSALRRQTVLDISLMSLATLGIALPNFVIAAVAILILVFQVQLFPAAGWGTISQLVLPAACLGLPYAAYIARLTRSGMLDVLSQDYIRTARAKGLSSTQVVLRHAIKGAMLPVVTYLGPATAGILTGVAGAGADLCHPRHGQPLYRSCQPARLSVGHGNGAGLHADAVYRQHTGRLVVPVPRSARQHGVT